MTMAKVRLEAFSDGVFGRYLASGSSLMDAELMQ